MNKRGNKTKIIYENKMPPEIISNMHSFFLGPRGCSKGFTRVISFNLRHP